MNFFEQELRRFTGKTTAFKSCKALYAGRACFIPLSGSRRARLEFVTSGVADQYDALQATILSVTNGKIDCLGSTSRTPSHPESPDALESATRISGLTAVNPSGTSRPLLPKSPVSHRPRTTTSCFLPDFEIERRIFITCACKITRLLEGYISQCGTLEFRYK